MKLRSLFAALCLFVGALTAQAQIATNTQSFFATAEGYVSSFNTNLLTFRTNDTVDVWTGMEYVSGVNTAASLGISYNAIALKTATLGLESITRNAGINGVILSQAAGLNIQKVYYDTKFEGYVNGGYDFSLRQPVGEVGARIFKALTDNTFAGIGIGERFGLKVSSFPTFSIFAGFKF